jgi:hypothetical protein
VLPVLFFTILRSLIIYTGSAISPCTTTFGGGGGLSAARPEPPDHSGNSCGYYKDIHIDFRAVVLSIWTQQPTPQIKQNHLRAGAAMAAHLRAAWRGQVAFFLVQPLVFDIKRHLLYS